jgi:hypothetical protein
MTRAVRRRAGLQRSPGPARPGLARRVPALKTSGMNKRGGTRGAADTLEEADKHCGGRIHVRGWALWSRQTPAPSVPAGVPAHPGPPAVLVALTACGPPQASAGAAGGRVAAAGAGGPPAGRAPAGRRGDEAGDVGGALADAMRREREARAAAGGGGGAGGEGGEDGRERRVQMSYSKSLLGRITEHVHKLCASPPPPLLVTPHPPTLTPTRAAQSFGVVARRYRRGCRRGC